MTPNRALLLVGSLLSSAASAQAISGSLSVAFTGHNEFGVPTTHVELRLACSLSCPSSRPELHYRVATGTDAWFVSAPGEKLGWFSAGFGSNDTGITVLDTQQFSSGVAFTTIAKGASCHCGNAIGEGGFIDIEAPMTVIPPFLTVGGSKAKAGFEWGQSVSARPKGNETVVVRFVGGGLDTSVTMGPSDFTAAGSGIARATPAAEGAMQVTATLMPYGASYSTMVTVDPGSTSGAGGGGGSGGSGGGGDAGGGEP